LRKCKIRIGALKGELPSNFKYPSMTDKEKYCDGKMKRTLKQGVKRYENLKEIISRTPKCEH
jgi:hypothetical protein